MSFQFDTTKEVTGVTNEMFMEAMFGQCEQAGPKPVTISFLGDPNTHRSWAAKPWPVVAAPESEVHNNFLAFAKFNPETGKIYKRQKRYFAGLYAVMLDDFGTKISLDKVKMEPSWVIETSPDNYQIGYFLAVPLEDPGMVDRVWEGLKASGQSDAGSSGLTARVGRLPVGANLKPKYKGYLGFKTRLVHWNPTLRYSVDSIVAGLELQLPPERTGPIAGEMPTNEFVAGVINTIKEAGLYKGLISPGRHDITCPWVKEHTDRADGGTAYYEPDSIFPLGGFKCLHDHCNDRHLSDLYKYLDITPDRSKTFLVSVDARGKKFLVPESIAAELLSEELKDKVSYCVESQQWHLYNNTYWEGDAEGDAVDPMLVKLISDATGPVGYSHRFFQAVKAMLRASGKLRLHSQGFDSLPFLNGVLNLKTGIMMDITPANAHTWVLPYKYDIRADCPNTKAWISDIVNGDAAMVEYTRAWMNAIITGRSDLQRFLHVVGSGRTGKSTFQRLLSVILGSKNVITTSLVQLEVNRFETSALVNKRLVIIADSDKYGKSVNTLKAITGQDPIRIERKNVSRMQDYVFDGMVLMASNEHIVSTDHTSGLDRRRAIIGFDNHISDVQLADWDRRGGESQVLYPEAPGIINWVLELSHEDVTNIIKDPPTQSMKSIMEAMEHSNPVVEWIKERIYIDPDSWSQIGTIVKVNVDGVLRYKNIYSQLYPSYCNYCEETGRSSMSCVRFKATLMDSLKTMKVPHKAVRKNIGNGVSGVRLLTAEELGLDPQRGLDDYEY